MKWERVQTWNENIAARLARTFDDKDGFDSAAFLADNVRSGRFDILRASDAAGELLFVTHTWDTTCCVLSVQGAGLSRSIAEFLAIMRRNGVSLVVFDTERKGLLRLLCNRVDLQHIDGERYAFEVDHEDVQQIERTDFQQHDKRVAQSQHSRC